MILLNIITMESNIEKNTTTSTIITKLRSFNNNVETIGHDVKKFNGHVRLLMESLRARGKATNYILKNEFKWYLACSDNEFVNYIKLKKESYKEYEEVTVDNLMLLAHNKYKILKDAGKCN